MKSPQIAAAQTVIIYIPDRLVWGAQLVVRGPSNALDATLGRKPHGQLSGQSEVDGGQGGA